MLDRNDFKPLNCVQKISSNNSFKNKVTEKLFAYKLYIVGENSREWPEGSLFDIYYT